MESSIRLFINTSTLTCGYCFVQGVQNMSNLTNQTIWCEHLGSTFVVCGVLFVSLTLLLSLAFNGLIFISFYIDSTLRTLPYVFIMNLAITNVISSLALIPMDIIYLINFPIFPFPAIVITFWNTAYLVLLTASILNFTAVSIDRFIRIKYPLQYMRYLTKQHITQSLVLLWVYVAILGIVMFFTFEIPKDGVYGFEISASFFVPFLVMNVFLPFCVIILLYCCIFRIMRRHIRCIDVQRTASLRHFDQHQIVPVRRHNSILRDISSIKTVCLVVFGFSLTWFPFLVFELYYSNNEYFSCSLDKADTVVCWLTYFSAVTSPVIYAARERKIKEVVWKLFSHKLMTNWNI